jgi:hypothetical protein
MDFLFELFMMICAATSSSTPHEPVVVILD